MCICRSGLRLIGRYAHNTPHRPLVKFQLNSMFHPVAAYGRLVDTLIAELTRDFYPRWVRL